MTSSPPITFLTHEFYPQRGGIATVVEEIAGATARLGHAVEVWAPELPPGAPLDPVWPFRVRRLPGLRGTHNWGCQFALACQLIAHRRVLRHATVYLPEPGPMLTQMVLQFFPGFRPRRLVLTFHGSEILRFHHHPARRWLTRRLIGQADRISTLSTHVRALLCERFPAAAAKTIVTRGAPRPSLGFGAGRARNGKIVVLTVGRLHPRKGQLQTLQALQALPPLLRDQLEYWIVGRANRPAYEQTLRAAAVAGLTVKFLGDVSDDQLATLYDQADIFALTSVDHGHSVEGFGLVYLDAAAHGLPVIAHEVGGVAEAVQDGVTGLLIPPQQPAQLTAAFARLITEPDLRERLGSAGRSWALSHSWSTSAALLFPSPGTSEADS